jgi:coatomer protein complex subunit alpha (xenin)
MSYQRTKNFEKLAFLYLITGNTEKLQKMNKIAQVRKDVHAQFETALWLGDAGERIKGDQVISVLETRTCVLIKFIIIVLKDMGQTQLAYLTALSHNLLEEAESLKTELTAKNIDIPTPATSSSAPIIPPSPIQPLTENWPQLAVSVGPFDSQLITSKSTTTTSASTKAAKVASTFAPTDDVGNAAEGEAWGVEGDVLLDEDGNPEIDADEMLGGAEEGDEGWDV